LEESSVGTSLATETLEIQSQAWPLGTTYGDSLRKKEQGRMKNEKGFSLIELLIVVAIIGIIAAIAIPNLLKSRQAANEASAIGSVRTIGTAQATYQSTGGLGRDYANDLPALNTDGQVDTALGSGSKSGFDFTCVGVPAVVGAGGTPSYFDTNADPQSTGVFGTGNRHFYSNEAFVIYQDPAAAIAPFAFPRNSTDPAAHTPIE
jgi:type IV pilus assembly protein PilA